MSMRDRVQHGTVADLLTDLYVPLPWVQRDDFDPMHSMKQLRAAVKAGFIELDESSGAPETIRFRLTPAGIRAAEAAALQEQPR